MAALKRPAIQIKIGWQQGAQWGGIGRRQIGEHPQAIAACTQRQQHMLDIRKQADALQLGIQIRFQPAQLLLTDLGHRTTGRLAQIQRLCHHRLGKLHRIADTARQALIGPPWSRDLAQGTERIEDNSADYGHGSSCSVAESQAGYAAFLNNGKLFRLFIRPGSILPSSACARLQTAEITLTCQR